MKLHKIFLLAALCLTCVLSLGICALAEEKFMTHEAFLAAEPESEVLVEVYVQATQEWEDVIYEVEKEVDEQLKDEPRGMGFCFNYWGAKRASLARRGIEWRSPSAMNPRVMFD